MMKQERKLTDTVCPIRRKKYAAVSPLGPPPTIAIFLPVGGKGFSALTKPER